MGVGKRLAKGLAPMATRIAPSVTAGFLREVLQRSIDGVGPFPLGRGSSSPEATSTRRSTTSSRAMSGWPAPRASSPTSVAW
jgi:hypothetical protein